MTSALSSSALADALTPRQIVAELDRYIVGQAAASAEEERAEVMGRAYPFARGTVSAEVSAHLPPRRVRMRSRWPSRSVFTRP
ncbi:hypothetical protein EON77_14315 [bacterium]|nr:MAG: hypothetical protein EON77_14315 [bacterium]